MRPIWLLLPLLAALAAAVTGEPEKAAPPDHLPTAEDLPGWSPSGPAQRYPVGSLHLYMNGAAPVVEEYGVEALAVRDWARKGQMISIRIYRMRDRIGAVGLMTQERGGSWRDLAAAPGGFETDHGCGFSRGRWYAQIDVLEGDSEVLPVVRDLARRIHGRLTGKTGSEPDLLADLRTPTLVPRTRVLMRGPLALANAESFADALAVDGFAMAGAARYGRGKKTSRLFLAEYESVSSAMAALKALAGKLEVPGDPGVMLSARSGPARVLAWREESRIRVIIR